MAYHAEKLLAGANFCQSLSGLFQKVVKLDPLYVSCLLFQTLHVQLSSHEIILIIDKIGLDLCQIPHGSETLSALLALISRVGIEICL